MIRVIGIDPGKTTGLAVCADGALELHSLDFWRAHGFVYYHAPEEVDLVVIEVATDTNVWHLKGRRTSAAAAARTGQHVGAVRREAELLAEGLQRTGYNVKTVPPRGKVKADVFNAYTGHKGISNEHTRDAGMMAYAEYCRLAQAMRFRA